MKLTKRQIKEMVKEELNELLAIVGGEPGMSKEQLLVKIMEMLQPLKQEQLAMIFTNIQQMLEPKLKEDLK
tara:strand:- start:677 stop:889 length:213 start_codon:yes stop_codon:yes gene_type:complete